MDKVRKGLRSVFCICLALGLFWLGPGHMPYAKAADIESLQDEYDRLEQQIADYERKNKAVEADLKDQTAYLNALNAQVAAAQKQADLLRDRIALLNKDISSLNGQIESLNAKITETQAKADGQEEQIRETFELLKKRMRAMYMAGGGTQLEFLLEAGDFETFLTRTELLRGVAKHDTALADQLSDELQAFNKLLKTLEADKASLQTQQTTLVARKQDVQASAQQLSAKEAGLNATAKKTQSYVQQLGKDSDLYQQEQERLKNHRDQVDQDIADYIKQYGSKPSDSNNSNNGNSNNSNNNGNSDNPNGGSSSKYLLWPLPGFSHITSYFGPRVGFGYTYHYGIDISGSGVYGHKIVAADGGVVLLSQWDKAFGYFLLIDHGNGKITRYAHCSRLLVSKGDSVTRGQKIAEVGDTGNVTGPHLHFEVYDDGKRYDPLKYLDPKDYK